MRPVLQNILLTILLTDIHPSIYPCIHAYINTTVTIQKSMNFCSKVINADIKITEESKLEACGSWERVEGEEEGRGGKKPITQYKQ